MSEPGSKGKTLVLAAMIFAVAMTFIDQTIVSIAVPEIQKELGLSADGVQWVINSYLLSLAALFAFGGRLADMVGHRKMVVIGVLVFAGASTMCGLTPKSSYAEAWIVTFRVLQGAGGAIMYPAALAIVVAAFPVNERGRAMAIFFGVAGGLTAIGPILGGILSQWTWRSIFWVNVPVAIVALVLTAIAKPSTQTRPGKLDFGGLVLIAGGVGLSVFGLQESQVWGWASPTVIGCIVAGVVLLVVFAFVELAVKHPLIEVRVFAIRAFLVENIVLFVSMICFIPIFFFASIYAQVALGDSSQEAGLYLLVFFAGFAPGVQVGGRMLDKQGAKRAVVLGCVIAAVGFSLWAGKVLGLSLNTQWYAIIIAGFGMGLMVGPANTDAINQVGRLSYGEATGVTQTVRNFGASVGLAVLGTVLLTQIRDRITSDLLAKGVSTSQANKIASSATQGGFGGSGSSLNLHGASASQASYLAHDAVAYGMRAVLYAMAVVMAVGAVVSIVGLRRGIHVAADAAEHFASPPTEASVRPATGSTGATGGSGASGAIS